MRAGGGWGPDRLKASHPYERANRFSRPEDASASVSSPAARLPGYPAAERPNLLAVDSSEAGRDGEVMGHSGFLGWHNDAVTDVVIRRFDGSALYVALHVCRLELGLSWRQVADQLWQLSAELNDRRRDHPISPSTLSNMADRPRTSCQHALFMLRWLDRTPESFLAGIEDGDDHRFALPQAVPTAGFAGA